MLPSRPGGAPQQRRFDRHLCHNRRSGKPLRKMTPAVQLDFANVRVLDGGMATELEKRGCDLSGPLWSAHVLRERPEMIEAVHDSYLQAGADCILTSSYQVSAEAYAEIGLTAEDAADSLRESVRLAENARDRFARYASRKILIAPSLR